MYVKTTIQGVFETRAITIDGTYLSPARSQKIHNHSPDGFMWGYEGSGPAQLALAILLEYTDEKTATTLYQDFKREIIAPLPQKDFVLTIDVGAWIRSQGIPGVGTISVTEESDKWVELIIGEEDNDVSE